MQNKDGNLLEMKYLEWGMMCKLDDFRQKDEWRKLLDNWTSEPCNDECGPRLCVCLSMYCNHSPQMCVTSLTDVSVHYSFPFLFIRVQCTAVAHIGR